MKASSFNLESYQNFKHTSAFAVKVSNLPKKFKFYKMMLYKIDNNDINSKPRLVFYLYIYFLYRFVVLNLYLIERFYNLQLHLNMILTNMNIL